MDLTILGSGTSIPSLTRASPGYLVRERATLALLDCGPGTLRRLLEVGVTPEEVTHVIFSHHHVDHCADLAPLLFASRNRASPRRAPLTIAGSPEFLAYFAELSRIHGDWLEPSTYSLSLLALDSGTERLGDFEVTACRVPHIPSSIAIRLEGDGGRSLVYSGDTDPSDDLGALAGGTDILLIEASTPDGEKLPGHLTPSLAGRIASRARPGRVVLTHFYPLCESADMAGQLRREYQGEAILARDLLRLSL